MKKILIELLRFFIMLVLTIVLLSLTIYLMGDSFEKYELKIQSSTDANLLVLPVVFVSVILSNLIIRKTIK